MESYNTMTRLQERVRLMEQVNSILCEKIGSLGLEMENLKINNTILKKMSRPQGALTIQKYWRRYILIKRIKEKSQQHRTIQLILYITAHKNTKLSHSPHDTFIDRRDFFLRKLRN